MATRAEAVTQALGPDRTLEPDPIDLSPDQRFVLWLTLERRPDVAGFDYWECPNGHPWLTPPGAAPGPQRCDRGCIGVRRLAMVRPKAEQEATSGGS